MARWQSGGRFGGPTVSAPPNTTPAGFCAYVHAPAQPAKLAGPFWPRTTTRLSPGTRNGPMSNVVSVLAACAAAAPSVMLPTVPAAWPLISTSARSSAATAMVPPDGTPGRVMVLAKKNCAMSAGAVAPVTPGAQIQAAPGIVVRFAVQPGTAFP